MSMSSAPPLSVGLNAADLQSIRPFTRAIPFNTGDLVFSEGDEADFIYFIESGRVSVFLQKFTSRQELCALGPGDYFGEMAVLNNGKRSASVSALEPTILLRADRDAFHRLLDQHPAIRNSIHQAMDRRNQELAIKEMLVDSTCIRGEKLQISIKGDPSLRESVFSRERYESVVDKLLGPLCPQIEEILLHRCAYSVAIHFNSGEVNTCSIFDPFCEDVHAANKLTDPAYIDRHFPRVEYAEKVAAIRGFHKHIARGALFSNLTESHLMLHDHLTIPWDPLTPEEIQTTLSKLSTLRQIPNLFLRNIKLNITRNSIRMQFNCDGTHFVSTANYLRFIDENLTVE